MSGFSYMFDNNMEIKEKNSSNIFEMMFFFYYYHLHIVRLFWSALVIDG